MKKLDIIYEDKELLVINKPAKLLTVSDGKHNDTLYSMAREYVKKAHKSNKIFIVHRLDRETSGVVIFAKKEEVKKHLQDNWNAIAKREYIAIVEGKMLNKEETIKEYLKEDKTHKVFVVKTKKGEYAETDYKVLKTTPSNSILNITIKTGKKHQIRVGLKNLGYPLIGDKTYGSKTNPLKRMGLHASKILLKFNNKEYIFEAKIPDQFKKYLKNK